MVTLTDISALEKMAADGLLKGLGQPVRGDALPWSLGSMRQLPADELVGLGIPASVETPLHALVDCARARVRSKRLVSHVWSGPLPDRSLYRLSDGVLLASPGLVLAQMATRLDVPRLVAVAMELCGMYGRVRRLGRGFLDRSPLASPASLGSYLAQLPGHLGVEKARRAADLAFVGSRSPLETSFSLMLSLPTAYGGCGFDPPELNHRIDPASELRPYCSQAWYEADVCWPDRGVICEVNSRQNHLTPEAQDHDAAKAGALEAMGWRVHSVTRLRDTPSRESLLSQIARSLGCEAPEGAPGAVRARGELARRLLAW